MTFDELSREQKIELKQGLVERRNREKGTSYEELADADSLVSDEEAREAFAGTEFVPEDFSSRGDRPFPVFSPDFVESWCDANITPSQYEKDHDKLHTNYDIRMALKYAADKIKGLCARYRSGRLSDDDIACMYRQEEEDDDMH